MRYRPEFAAALTQSFLAGGETPDLSEYREVVGEAQSEDAAEVDTELLSQLIDHALDEEFADWSDRNRHIAELDGWLAPRVHSALRITRRLAADRGFWAWVAVEAGSRYVHHRWGEMKESGDGSVTPWRYTGEAPLRNLRNGVARLWWGAEMVRNGPSYEYVRPTFARVRTAQWVLELRYSRFRAAAIAFVRVCEGLDGGKPLSDVRMQGLSTKANAYLTLTALEEIGGGEADESYDAAWRRHVPTLTEITAEELHGPEDGYAPAASIERVAAWLRALVNDS